MHEVIAVYQVTKRLGQSVRTEATPAPRSGDCSTCWELERTAAVPAAGRPCIPIVYRVGRLNNGQPFGDRRAATVRHSGVIFTLAVSFEVPEPGLDHQHHAGESDDPESHTAAGRRGTCNSRAVPASVAPTPSNRVEGAGHSPPLDAHRVRFPIGAYRSPTSGVRQVSALRQANAVKSSRRTQLTLRGPGRGAPRRRGG
jgi:hypothetical protein